MTLSKGAVTYAFPVSSVADGETGLKALCRRERVKPSRFGRLGFFVSRLLSTIGFLFF